MREPREYEAPLCAQVGGDYWFPENGDDSDYDHSNIQKAKRICSGCIHRIECAEWGIHNERFGIWGGLTTQQIRIIRRRRGIKVRREESA